MGVYYMSDHSLECRSTNRFPNGTKWEIRGRVLVT